MELQHFQLSNHGRGAGERRVHLIAKAAYKWRVGDYRDDISAIVVYLPLFDD